MSSRLTQPNTSVTVMSAPTVDDGPPALQEIRHSLPGAKRCRRRRWRSSSRGDKGRGGGLGHIRANPATTRRRAPLLSNLPIGPYYLTDHIQPVARHMARRFRSPGVFQAATIGLACVMLLSSPHAAVAQRRTGAIAGRLVDHESHSPIRG